MSSWDQANRGEKLGLVWRNRKEISQTIKVYLYLPFFLLTLSPAAGGPIGHTLISLINALKKLKARYLQKLGIPQVVS
jgi:hypothetical protein